MDLSADFLQRRPANFRPMTPIQFLRRAADVFPDRLAIIHGEIRYTWRDHDRRCRMLASALMRTGIGKGDVVAILSPEHAGHAGSPFRRADDGRGAQHAQHTAGCRSIAFILEHSETEHCSSTGNGAPSPSKRCPA